MCRILQEYGIAWKQKNGGIRIMVDSTLEALPILELVKGCITGFEVIQGTMDDVFLNVTQEENNRERG